MSRPFLFAIAGFIFVICIGAIVRLFAMIFSTRIRNQVLARPVLHCIWFLAALFGALVVFVPIRVYRPPEPGELRIETTMKSLQIACESYFTEFGSYPSGSNREIVRTLCGDNPRKIIFLELASRDTNSTGQVVDPWGTPYQFSFEASDPMISSAGPNQIFETNSEKSDDLHCCPSSK
jgi:ABC-type transport system involved in multi-copper enzyme maturation permease subunit